MLLGYTCRRGPCGLAIVELSLTEFVHESFPGWSPFFLIVLFETSGRSDSRDLGVDGICKIVQLLGKNFIRGICIVLKKCNTWKKKNEVEKDHDGLITEFEGMMYQSWAPLSGIRVLFSTVHIRYICLSLSCHVLKSLVHMLWSPASPMLQITHRFSL